jgi:putative CocE/NonD family hydrolase
MQRSATPSQFQYETDFTIRVPTSSGVCLGATITRPLDAGPVPALVWYDPYRNAWDGSVGDAAHYFAARGYAFVNLHARGTGNSAGVSLDEYPVAETRDGYDAVEWLAAQRWCSGRVGMLGASYSGFTCLQVAALDPPSLYAIAPAYFTDRRYTDDCHYKGGCLRGYYDMLTYGMSMVAKNGLPPHPRAAGEQWAEMWQERLEEGEPYLLKWLAHPVEDDYWRQGSVVGQYDRIRAACFLIGGWHDGYVNPPLRTFRALTAPKRLLMGPWNHTYPHLSHCGPRIQIYEELLRWWDRWLREVDNGIDREPPVMVYVQEQEPPRPDRLEIAGKWHAAPALPEGDFRTWSLGAGVLCDNSDDTADAETDSFEYRPAASRQGGVWDAGIPFGLPSDQRPDEVLALNYTSEPLTEELVLLGQPVVELAVSADVPALPFAVRLSEVTPDGVSVLVTKGVLNISRRKGMDRAVPLPEGNPVPLRVELGATAWRFQPGNRLRLSINGSDFPNLWPTPYHGVGTIHRGGDYDASLTLPLWRSPAEPPVLPLPSLETPRSPGTGSHPPAWRVTHDVLENRYHFVLASGAEFSISDRDPAIAYARSLQVATAEWEGVSVRSEAAGALTSDDRAFHLSIALHVTLNGVPYFSRSWSRSYERHLL